MKFVSISLAFAGAVVASEFDAIVKSVRQENTTWSSGLPDRFGSLEDVRTLLGARMPGDKDFVEEGLEASHHDAKPRQDLPDTFDARTQWAKCTVISKIRDQSSCGSCWAFSATETFEGSRCIATGFDVMFSADDTAGCCSGFRCGLSQGCNGGQQVAALRWMTNVGVVTGGNYVGQNGTAADGCKPYKFGPCAHHVPPTATYPVCPEKEYSETCNKECANPAYTADYESDKVKGGTATSLSSVEGMMSALYTSGPLAVAFTVYSDFPTYKSGVYKHTTGSELGGHAVTMIGWGTEGGEDYWLVKNSWNDQWGDGGTFKIARGTDECGIESSVGAISFSSADTVIDTSTY